MQAHQEKDDRNEVIAISPHIPHHPQGTHDLAAYTRIDVPRGARQRHEDAWVLYAPEPEHSIAAHYPVTILERGDQPRDRRGADIPERLGNILSHV